MSPEKTHSQTPIAPDGSPSKVPKWRTWDASHGTYLAGQAAIDGANHLGAEMDRKWGIGRLRLLVPTDLREKFDRQRYLFQAAVQRGELPEVLEQSRRMENAWKALDEAAEDAGALKLDPAVWELAIINPDSTVSVVALVRTAEEAVPILTDGRAVTVYTTAEIGRLLAAMPTVAAVKQKFPGATVEAVRSPRDSLEAIADPTGFDTAMPHDDEAPL